MGTVQDEAYYGKIYRESERYARAYWDSPDFPLYARVWQYIAYSGKWPVVELGSGTGQLAHYLWDVGIRNYLGIDFSGEAISRAGKRCEQRFVQADLRKGLQSILEREKLGEEKKIIFVGCELLEHLQDDLGLVRSLPAKSVFVFSVPMFNERGHARWFTNKESVQNQYGGLLDLIDETRFNSYLIYRSVRKKTCYVAED